MPALQQSWARKAFVAVVSLALLLAALLAIVLWNWPFTKQKMEASLSSATGAIVHIDRLERTYFPPGFDATGVRFGRTDSPDQPVTAAIKRLTVKARWMDLLLFRRRASQILVYETQLLIPSRSETRKLPSRGKQGLEIGEILFHRVIVDFATKDPAAKPIQISMRQLVLTGIYGSKPFHFDAYVENPMPHGEVHEQGNFGPWISGEPSRTPVDGTYTFQNANLSDLHGVSGLLQAQGKFHGELGKIEIEGTATVPDFRVIHSSHSVKLDSTYTASANATNGDVDLHAVLVHLGHTTIESTGRVAGEPGHPGKVAALKASVVQGRVEDLENLFIASKSAPLSGAVRLETSIRLPSGHAHFFTRLEMAGHFVVTGETFRGPKTQGMLNRLAESAVGESKGEQDTDERVMHSSMQANVVVRNGMAAIDHLVLTAPDTTVHMDGSFHLISKEMNMKGTLQTGGNLSDTQTGFKSFAVKMITPFLKKANRRTVVPFAITGRYGDLHTHLDLNQKQKL